MADPVDQQPVDYGDSPPDVPGNIQFWNRPHVSTKGTPYAKEGKYGTVHSFSREDNGLEVLVPQIYDSQWHTPDDAWNHYKQTGQHMGKWKDWHGADRFAQKYHEDAAAGKYDTKPMADKTAKHADDEFAQYKVKPAAKPAAAAGGDDEFANYKRPAATPVTTTTDEVEPPEQPGFTDVLGREASSFGQSLRGMVPGIYHSFTDAPNAREQREVGKDPGALGKFGLGVFRNTVEPLQDAADWYKREYKSGAMAGRGVDTVDKMLTVAPEGLGSAGASVVAGKVGGDLTRLPSAVSENAATLKGIGNMTGPLGRVAGYGKAIAVPPVKALGLMGTDAVRALPGQMIHNAGKVVDFAVGDRLPQGNLIDRSSTMWNEMKEGVQQVRRANRPPRQQPLWKQAPTTTEGTPSVPEQANSRAVEPSTPVPEASPTQPLSPRVQALAQRRAAGLPPAEPRAPVAPTAGPPTNTIQVPGSPQPTAPAPAPQPGPPIAGTTQLMPQPPAAPPRPPRVPAWAQAPPEAAPEQPGIAPGPSQPLSPRVQTLADQRAAGTFPVQRPAPTTPPPRVPFWKNPAVNTVGQPIPGYNQGYGRPQLAPRSPQMIEPQDTLTRPSAGSSQVWDSLGMNGDTSQPTAGSPQVWDSLGMNGDTSQAGPPQSLAPQSRPAPAPQESIAPTRRIGERTAREQIGTMSAPQLKALAQQKGIQVPEGNLGSPKGEALATDVKYGVKMNNPAREQLIDAIMDRMSDQELADHQSDAIEQTRHPRAAKKR